MSQDFRNVYVIGKNTPNKLKLFQILGGRDMDSKSSNEYFEDKLETTLNDKKYTIMNISGDEVDSLKKDEKNDINIFYYVYDVDDRETFDSFDKIHQKLKQNYDESRDHFVLYGITCNIKNERSVSFEELMTTAVKNKLMYFELHEFNEKMIHKNIDFAVNNNATVYFVGSEQSGYNEMLKEEINNSLNEFKFLQYLFIPLKIEEMEPLDVIAEKSTMEKSIFAIKFIYSPYNRETFTSIEKYLSMSPNLQNYCYLELHLSENKLIKEEGKEKEVTSLEVKKLSKRYATEQKDRIYCIDYPRKKQSGSITYRFSRRFVVEKYDVDSGETYNHAYYYKCDISGHEVVYFDYFNSPDINFWALLDDSFPIYHEYYNYLIACDTSGKIGTELQEKEEHLLSKLKPNEIQRYIRFKDKEFKEVLKQYYELQEPAKETIHIFGNNKLEEVLLDTEVIGIDKDEECKFVRFNNHIFKYKVAFHETCSFNEDMKCNLFFFDIDDESRIESILNDLLIHDTKSFLILIQNEGIFTEDEEQSKMKYFNKKFGKISNKLELFKLSSMIKFDKESNMFKYKDGKNTYEAIENIFIKLMKGEEQSKQFVEYEESGCCRV